MLDGAQRPGLGCVPARLCTVALSLSIHKASLGFPRVEQFGGLADQLRRATKAIPALLAEGAGRQASSDAEFRRYVIMAMGSADEARL